MDSFKLLFLRYYKEHKVLFKGAVIVTIVIVAALFFALRGEEGEFSEQFTDQSLTASNQGEEPAGTEQTSEIYIDIGGQVKSPGVYRVPEGTRLFEVIEKAGGLTEDAYIDQVNQAEVVSDGQKIIIPSVEDMESSISAPGGAAGGEAGKDAQGRININTADSETLQEIPGVGPVTAEKIIAYRNESGRFSKIEDIKNVSGIGEKTFEKIKDKITV